jgi:hypothetical protein
VSIVPSGEVAAAVHALLTATLVGIPVGDAAEPSGITADSPYVIVWPITAPLGTWTIGNPDGMADVIVQVTSVGRPGDSAR